MNVKLKTLSLFVTLFLFSVAPAQTPPAERKDGDLKFESFTVPFEGQIVYEDTFFSRHLCPSTP